MLPQMMISNSRLTAGAAQANRPMTRAEVELCGRLNLLSQYNRSPSPTTHKLSTTPTSSFTSSDSTATPARSSQASSIHQCQPRPGIGSTSARLASQHHEHSYYYVASQSHHRSHHYLNKPTTNSNNNSPHNYVFSHQLTSAPATPMQHHPPPMHEQQQQQQQQQQVAQTPGQLQQRQLLLQCCHHHQQTTNSGSSSSNKFDPVVGSGRRNGSRTNSSSSSAGSNSPNDSPPQSVANTPCPPPPIPTPHTPNDGSPPPPPQHQQQQSALVVGDCNGNKDGQGNNTGNCPVVSVAVNDQIWSASVGARDNAGVGPTLDAGGPTPDAGGYGGAPLAATPAVAVATIASTLAGPFGGFPQSRLPSPVAVVHATISSNADNADLLKANGPHQQHHEPLSALSRTNNNSNSQTNNSSSQTNNSSSQTNNSSSQAINNNNNNNSNINFNYRHSINLSNSSSNNTYNNGSGGTVESVQTGNQIVAQILDILKINKSGSGCGFCRRNREPPSVYMNHQLRDGHNQVTCPQLRKHVCELCGATGAQAHTRSYCNVSQRILDAGVPEHHSTTRMLRNMSMVSNSRYNAAGKLRHR